MQRFLNFSQTCILNLRKDLKRLLSTKKPKTERQRRSHSIVEKRFSQKEETSVQRELTHYLSLHEPSYALLIKGSWGVGKTWQVERSLPSENVLYISLFGLKSADDIHAAIASKFVPFLAKLGGPSKEISDELKFGKGSYKLIQAAILSRIDSSYTLVFDDIERSLMEVKEMMSVISYFLERRKFRVVLIGDEAKLEKCPDYSEAKEKVIGRTVQAEPQHEQALEYFIDLISAPPTPGGSERTLAHKFVHDHLEDIIQIFKQSELHSLRVARYAIEDLVRLRQIIPDQHLENSDAIRQLVVFFFAISLEIHSERLDPKELLKRSTQRFFLPSEDEVKTKSPFHTANDRYPSVDLGSEILNDDIIQEIFDRGIYAKGSLSASLNKSGIFTRLEHLPPWRRLYRLIYLEPPEFEQALQEMNKQIKEHTAHAAGEILHIMALKLLLVSEEIEGGDIDTVTQDAIAYIDSVKEQGNLPPFEFNLPWRRSIPISYDGFGYWTTDKTKVHFNKILDHLGESMRMALEEELPTTAQELLVLVKNNADILYKQLCPSGDEVGRLYYQPVLSKLAPKTFMDAWLSGSPSNRIHVKTMLEVRFENLSRPTYQAEKKWGLKILKLLEEAQGKATGIERFQLKYLIPESLIALRNGDIPLPQQEN